MINFVYVECVARLDARFIFVYLCSFAFATCSPDVLGPNRKPIAVAGLDIVTNKGELVDLNAGQSFDPDGDEIKT